MAIAVGKPLILLMLTISKEINPGVWPFLDNKNSNNSEGKWY